MALKMLLKSFTLSISLCKNYNLLGFHSFPGPKGAVIWDTSLNRVNPKKEMYPDRVLKQSTSF